jgi:hypothetical protein
MKTPSVRSARLATWLAIPAALIVSGIAVSGASYSAFSSTTSNPTSNWQTGSVVLTDDDGDAALFTATNLQPGSTGSKCIAVTSTGSLASTVKLYSTSLATTKALSSYIDLTITQGTGGTFGDCATFTPLATNSSVFTGTVADFGTVTTYAGGLGVWAPTGSGSETRTYRINYSVNANTPNTSQAGSASVAFKWEAQNN